MCLNRISKSTGIILITLALLTGGLSGCENASKLDSGSDGTEGFSSSGDKIETIGSNTSPDKENNSSDENTPRDDNSSSEADPGEENNNEFKVITQEELEELAQDAFEHFDIPEVNGAFSVTDDKGKAIEPVNGVYTITKKGEYTITGKLENGHIVVDAADCSVTLVLNNAALTCDTFSPILIEKADEVKIKSPEGTSNVICDMRPAKADEEDTDDTEGSEVAEGNAAIWGKSDIDFSGKGKLIVISTFNNGIQSKKKLTFKNTELSVSSINTSIKADESVEIKSGKLTLNSSKGKGIKTEDSDVSSKGNQRGSVLITGGEVTITSFDDGIKASYNVEISDSVVNIEADGEGKQDSVQANTSNPKQGSFNFGGFWGNGGFGSNGRNQSKSVDYPKGIKAANEVIISNSTIVVDSADDGISAGKDEKLENGEEALGNVYLKDSTVKITSGDDGIHAEYTLVIDGGTLDIIESYEGLEGNLIIVKGGFNKIYASDDAINASSGRETPTITFEGGYTEAVVPSGDTDGVDSNGNIVISGGTILVKCGSSMGGVSGSIDVDGTITQTGGTVIAFGGICETPQSGINGYASSGTGFSAGKYSLKDSSGKEVFSFELDGSYSGAWFSDESLTVGSEYTLYKDGTEVLSWTQESGIMNASRSGFGFGGGFGGGGFGGNMPGGNRPGSSSGGGRKR